MPEDQRLPRAADLSAPGLSREGWLELLRTGTIDVLGRMPYSSNATFLVTLTDGDCFGGAIYKPVAGERPLWDFPPGLYQREIAAYELATALGLGQVPETVLREDAPHGVGSLQRFINADLGDDYFSVFQGGAHDAELRVLAGFDVLANNADRKGGHVLVDPEGNLFGIDHGLCFHYEFKLRTVIWDYAGEEVPEEILAACEAIAEVVPDVVAAELDEDEVAALQRRARAILVDPTFPTPYHRRAYPWPLV